MPQSAGREKKESIALTPHVVVPAPSIPQLALVRRIFRVPPTLRSLQELPPWQTARLLRRVGRTTGRRYQVGHHAVTDIKRPRFNFRRELHHGQRVLGNGVLHASLHPQLVTDVSSVNLVAARVLDTHNAAFDVMSSLHEGDFTLLFFESHNEFLHFAINPGRTRCTWGAVVSNFAV